MEVLMQYMKRGGRRILIRFTQTVQPVVSSTSRGFSATKIPTFAMVL